MSLKNTIILLVMISMTPVVHAQAGYFIEMYLPPYLSFIGRVLQFVVLIGYGVIMFFVIKKYT